MLVLGRYVQYFLYQSRPGLKKTRYFFSSVLKEKIIRQSRIVIGLISFFVFRRKIGVGRCRSSGRIEGGGLLLRGAAWRYFGQQGSALAQGSGGETRRYATLRNATQRSGVLLFLKDPKHMGVMFPLNTS